MPVKIYVQRRAWDFEGFGLYFRFKGHGPNEIGIPNPLTIVMHNELDASWHEAASEPTVRLQPQEAQYLMDQLWDAGLRPTEGTGSAGSLAATQRHLADMRAIVFKQAPKL